VSAVGRFPARNSKKSEPTEVPCKTCTPVLFPTDGAVGLNAGIAPGFGSIPCGFEGLNGVFIGFPIIDEEISVLPSSVCAEWVPRSTSECVADSSVLVSTSLWCVWSAIVRSEYLRIDVLRLRAIKERGLGLDNFNFPPQLLKVGTESERVRDRLNLLLIW
jgi:hypothetical protein